MIKAVIVEDESSCSKSLNFLIEKHCPGVEVVGIFSNGKIALENIDNLKPDLVFLDVEMPVMNGFEMLEKLPSIDFSLIFTTSYDQYAIKAFRYSAIDYLLKPIDKEELVAAINKVQNSRTLLPPQIEVLKQNTREPALQLKRLALPTLEGYHMASIQDILYVEADDNYTIFNFRNKQKLVVTQTLKDVEETLEDHAFLRVHRCFLVNLNEVEKYCKGEGGYVVLSDGTTIDVSRTRKESLLKKLLPQR
jgi:two-component system, LytTR family, response regulator